MQNGDRAEALVKIIGVASAGLIAVVRFLKALWDRRRRFKDLEHRVHDLEQQLIALLTHKPHKPREPD